MEHAPDLHEQLFAPGPRTDGVLPAQHLEKAMAAGIVDAGRYTIPPGNVQPASLDLRLGERATRLRCSFLPGDDAVADKLAYYALDELDLRGRGAVLETGRPYLVELKERLDLPSHMHGKANPKSSTGRVDVFTRVITDGGRRFDEVAAGYQGGLYLEIVPLSFPVRVREDLTLNQLRLAIGRPRLTDDEIHQAHAAQPLLCEEGAAVPGPALMVADGLFLGLDLRGDADGRVGYCARDSAPLLDLGSAEPVEPDLFWEPVRREEGDRVALSPRRFYLLMSRQAVCVPPGLAAEMTAYDPTSGELRTHYAGFFDPGFGFDPAGHSHGSRAALEVRAHDVPFMIEDGQPVCKLTFERMLEEPVALYGAGIGSSYQGQRETLSKWFRGAHRPVGAVAPR
ncbi:MAG: 2'-deoxycytidine 5'-triphosphate deaminase [Actinomycetota bacterium]|nr:2'-deoxycytidine 5'-triphosphate deaminase [Actinomycetota bacterium]MDA8280657.1 2'-deoxycytidine 5'-triphosphate deaminase [Actinomycetota bacterium]